MAEIEAGVTYSGYARYGGPHGTTWQIEYDSDADTIKFEDTYPSLSQLDDIIEALQLIQKEIKNG